MSLQSYYNEFAANFADPDEKVCACRGSGWALSDLDTWHKCPYHCKANTPHPEDDCGDYEASHSACEIPDYTPTDEDMDAAQFKPAKPEPPKPLTEGEIPF